jgi:hypothetical protein
MGNLYVSEDSVFIDGKHNDDDAKRFRGGMCEPYETAYEDTSSLYKACVKQHGRCTGKMFRDVVGPDPTVRHQQQAGWVFLKAAPKDRYGITSARDKSNKAGCIETWVEVYVSPPVRSVSWSEPVFPTFGKGVR